jgi:hypothetical protein
MRGLDKERATQTQADANETLFPPRPAIIAIARAAGTSCFGTLSGGIVTRLAASLPIRERENAAGGAESRVLKSPNL